MKLPTIQLTCMASNPDGQPAIGDIFRATLDKTDVHLGYGFVVPQLLEEIIDASGTVIFNLWPNELGTKDSRYRVVAINPDRAHKYLDLLVWVPDRPCNLHELSTAAINSVGE
jgi:hypothetical protein